MSYALETDNAAQLLQINRDDEKTQKARLDSLKGKRCLYITAPCIGGMSNQMKHSVQWILDRGIHLTAVFNSKEDGLYKIMSEAKLFNEAVIADMNATNSAELIVKALGDRTYDGIFSPYEPAIVLMAEVGQILGIGPNTPEAYKIARSKNLSRVATRKAGLATPRSGVCKTPEDIPRVLGDVGFPCIMKPSSGAGSCGVLRANNIEEGRKAYDTIQADLKKTAWLQWSPGCEETSVLVEQCLIGDEFDVDMLFYNGKVMYCQVVDNWPCLAPYYLETGSQMPSTFSAAIQQGLKDYARDCVLAMGFKTGCFHVEVMQTAEGPVLIEVNARQGGGPNQVFNIEMCGVDIFANYFMALMNVPINPPRHQPEFAMADYAITSPFTGILEDESHMDHIKAHPDTYSTRVDVAPGTKCSGLDTGFPQWLNQFVVRADSPAAAKALVESLIDGIEKKIHVKPAPAE